MKPDHDQASKPLAAAKAAVHDLTTSPPIKSPALKKAKNSSKDVGDPSAMDTQSMPLEPKNLEMAFNDAMDPCQKHCKLS